MSNKTCSKVVFYCKGKPESFKVKGKDVYSSWPKLLHTDPSSAISWAEGMWHKSPYFSVEVDNSFKDAMVLDNFDERGQSSKIPKAVVYNEEKDVYLMIDFRLDGLVETLTNSSISKQIIKCDMALRFSGGNYYFVPRNGKSYTEYEKQFNKTHNKSKVLSTSKIDVGIPFEGNYNGYYVYLGQYKCTKDEADQYQVKSYEGEKVHVYLQVGIYCEYNKKIILNNDVSNPVVTISKSKM